MMNIFIIMAFFISALIATALVIFFLINYLIAMGDRRIIKIPLDENYITLPQVSRTCRKSPFVVQNPVTSIKRQIIKEQFKSLYRISYSRMFVNLITLKYVLMISDLLHSIIEHAVENFFSQSRCVRSVIWSTVFFCLPITSVRIAMYRHKRRLQ
jgi:hypothetical protein